MRELNSGYKVHTGLQICLLHIIYNVLLTKIVLRQTAENLYPHIEQFKTN